LAGVGPYDPVTRAVVGRSIEEQTAQAIRNAAAVLAGAGCGLTDVVNCTAYLAKLERDWDGFDAVYGTFFESPYPARTTVGTELKGILVELSIVAAPRPQQLPQSSDAHLTRDPAPSTQRGQVTSGS